MIRLLHIKAKPTYTTTVDVALLDDKNGMLDLFKFKKGISTFE
jgi:hypothetical protein